MPKAEEIGKFIYIEPNNLNIDKPSNAIPQPYEDYCMAVDLQVEIPSRDSCGDPNSKKTLYFSSDNGTISFFGGSGGGDGKQGFLTTNFTDISATNVGRGNKECLGIESINITYDTWFFPTVTINFVDVRGASLMMPQEHAYKTELSHKSTDKTQISGGSFFKALFSFPYPLFKLTVKGFYGRAATYNLAVRDFKASFNSNTGNFECVVQFIGYMFGVYTDIPMTYLVAAPYIERGLDKKYGSVWESSEDFFYHSENDKGEEVKTSTRMMTFPEFKQAIFSANTQLDKIVASTEVALNMSEVLKKRTALNEIKNTFIDLKFEKVKYDKTLEKYLYYAFTKKNNTELAEKVIVLQQKVDNFCNANFSKDDSGSLRDTLKPLFDLIKIDGNNKTLIPLIKVSNNDEGNLCKESVEGDFTKDDIEKALKSVGENEINFNDEDNKLYEGKAIATLNSGIKPAYAVVFCLCTDFVEYLDKQDVEYEKEIKNFEINLKSERLKSLKEILGFYPSIKNIFDMTFAHMETFVKSYYGMLTDVSRDIYAKKRYPGNFGITSESQTDFRIFNEDNPTDATKPSEKQVPPFPLFAKEVIKEDGTKINETVGPWEFSDKNMNMPEMQFVIKLLNAAKFYSEEARKVNEVIEKAKEAQGAALPHVDKLIPVTLYDFFNLDFNPYECVKLAGSKDDDRTNQIILTFFLRWFYYANTFTFNSSNEMKYFAQMEAYNLKKALPNLTENIRKTLLEDDIRSKMNNGVDLWEIRGKKTLFTVPYGGFNYDWLKTDIDGKEYYVLPVGEFDVNNIKTDLERGDVKTSNKYVLLDGKDFSSANTSNFKIVSEGSYFDRLIDEIKNADDSDKNVKNNIRKNLDEASVFTKSITKREEPYIKKGKIFTTGKEEKVETVYTNGSISAGVANINQVTRIEEKTYTLSEIIAGVVPSDNSENLTFIGDGTAIDADFDKHVFKNDMFTLQQNDLSRAYMFVMSLPIRTSVFNNGKYIINNGTTLKSLLLREGAYWWRYDMMDSGSDPINCFSEKYDAPSKYELYITNEREDNTLSFKNKNDNSCKYVSFWGTNSSDIQYKTSVGRKNAVKKYFADWVKTDFKSILFYVDKHPNDYIEDKDYKALMMDVLTDFESVVDEAPLSMDKGKESKKSNITEPNFYAIFKKFIEMIKNVYPKESDLAILTTETNLADGTDIINDKDLMLSTYMVLKSLYDKWFCGTDPSTWYLNSEKSDFKNFKYIDSYYNDIGYKLVPNINNTLSLIDKYMPNGNIKESQEVTQYEIMSVYQFLSENCEKIGVYFKSLPLIYGLDCKDKEKIETMFDAIPFSKYTNGKGMNDGQTYICMYAYKPSEHLDIRDDGGQYDWINDSFDIADISGKNSNTLPSALYEVGKNTIPAFGVTFAAQNQSYFKTINVNMSNPMQTEASIATTMMLANKGGDGPREMTLYGQDLYRIYSNYSYTCDVEMIGNSQIVPMMYFQLNNIPMFRGAYMITKVEHNLHAGSMITKFTGVRQNKNATPLVVASAMLIDGPNDGVVESTYKRREGGESTSNDNSWTSPDNVKQQEDSSKITSETPLICLTPAHGPNTQKSREWAWSSRLIDEFIIPGLKNAGYGDFIHRCNIDGANTSDKGYSGSEVRKMISQYGSEKVISYVPHWNGAAGNFFGAFINKKNLYTREGSKLFATICTEEAEKVKESVKNGNYGKHLPEGMLDGKSKVCNLGDSNSDWAANLDCDCVLTENWFADYPKIGTDANGKAIYGWEGVKWLESEQGLQAVANVAINSIIRFIKER